MLQRAGHEAEVFDPNCCDGAPEDELRARLRARRFDLIGVSTTGMTLRYDLALAHLAKREQPHALLVAGGMEATFDPETLFQMAPIDLVVLGEGEFPLLEMLDALAAQQPVQGVRGTAIWRMFIIPASPDQHGHGRSRGRIRRTCLQYSR